MHSAHIALPDLSTIVWSHVNDADAPTASLRPRTRREIGLRQLVQIAAKRVWFSDAMKNK
jgi:hypothetical protein